MPLKFRVFLGSTRDNTPPRPARLGERVARACVAAAADGTSKASLTDPLEIDLPPAFKPHFAYAQGKAPGALDDLANAIRAADG